jgi:hypothetical protein
MSQPRKSPVWNSLSVELDDPGGPARRWLAQAFPNLRSMQTHYRESVGPILVEAGAANPGTLGTAFDVWTQLQITGQPRLGVARLGAGDVGGPVAEEFFRLMASLGPEKAPVTTDQPVPWTGSSPGLSDDAQLRLSWAAAALIEVFRSGAVMPGSPLSGLTTDHAVDLLGLASPAVLEELGALTTIADQRLLPQLRALAAAGPTWLGPTFAGSRLMPADADLIAGHTLVELKTRLGRKTPTGRKAALDGLTIYQVVGYVLHDHDGRYALRSVGLYEARYGHWSVWDLDQLLPDLAGAPVHLPKLRAQWASMLRTGKVPDRPPTSRTRTK